MGETAIQIEESYSEDILDLIAEWKNYCKSTSETHQRVSEKLHMKHIIYGLPSIIIPISMVFVSQIIIDQEINKIVSGSGFLVSGVLSSIHKFFDFSNKSNDHQMAANQYNLVVLFIDSTLSRAERYRLPADVCLATIRTEIKNLDTYSPNINTSCLSNCLR